MERVERVYCFVRRTPYGELEYLSNNGQYFLPTVLCGHAKYKWSARESAEIKCPPGTEAMPLREGEPWHYETKDFQEARQFMVTNSLPVEFSKETFHLLDIRGEIECPLSCTVLFKGGKFKKYALSIL